MAAQEHCTGQDNNKMMYPTHRERQKEVLVTGLQSSLQAIVNLYNRSGIRYCVVRGGESHTGQMSTITWYQLDLKIIEKLS